MLELNATWLCSIAFIQELKDLDSWYFIHEAKVEKEWCLRMLWVTSDANTLNDEIIAA